eukprot:835585-Pyramimonas_sp.AAC.1
MIGVEGQSENHPALHTNHYGVADSDACVWRGVQLPLELTTKAAEQSGIDEDTSCEYPGDDEDDE